MKSQRLVLALVLGLSFLAAHARGEELPPSFALGETSGTGLCTTESLPPLLPAPTALSTTCTATCTYATSVTLTCAVSCTAVHQDCFSYKTGYVRCENGTIKRCPMCPGPPPCDYYDGRTCSEAGSEVDCVLPDGVDSICECWGGRWECLW